MLALANMEASWRLPPLEAVLKVCFSVRPMRFRLNVMLKRYTELIVRLMAPPNSLKSIKRHIPRPIPISRRTTPAVEQCRQYHISIKLEESQEYATYFEHDCSISTSELTGMRQWWSISLHFNLEKCLTTIYTSDMHAVKWLSKWFGWRTELSVNLKHPKDSWLTWARVTHNYERNYLRWSSGEAHILWSWHTGETLTNDSF